jgi:hypothetical protein
MFLLMLMVAMPGWRLLDTQGISSYFGGSVLPCASASFILSRSVPLPLTLSVI